MKIHRGNFAAIFGGACAGSEAASRLAHCGVYVAVFEQHTLPYGKIEDGLPKWHIKLRDKEESKIDERLSHPNIFFIPNTRLGRDVEFEDVVRNWGFGAVILANGAWRDRPLPVPGIDDYVEKGLYYQNPFVDWFNHYHEPGYTRHHYEVQDGAIVVGGGLASIDVAKILMLETTQRALAEKGCQTDIFTLEHQGIPKTLETLGLSFSDLGLRRCTLFYRRRSEDMPLSYIYPDPTPEDLEKAHRVRQKILSNAQQKYLFHFQECCKPVEKITVGERLAGLVFQRTRVENGRVVSVPGSEFAVRSPLVISSIGSIPEPIPGIPTSGELFNIPDEDTGRLAGYPNVYGLGNVVTGKGNIRDSELHARKIVHYIIENVFHCHAGAIEADRMEDDPAAQAEVERKGLLDEGRVQVILKRIANLQRKAGFDGNYQKWVETHRPPRLENLIGYSKEK
ncbi:MAG: FAD-dependent oxidoreductase [Calditrichaceae bacterium]|nr:FAD-dependent oxidoreductase [Calditrichia bacterium]NUQ40041.1 FAD-dependent oxidoreductase [Calditrichaceae bacterium]